MKMLATALAALFLAAAPAAHAAKKPGKISSARPIKISSARPQTMKHSLRPSSLMLAVQSGERKITPAVRRELALQARMRGVHLNWGLDGKTPSFTRTRVLSLN